MMIRKALILTALIAGSLLGSASAVIVLHIDDFSDEIGDSGDAPADTFGIPAVSAFLLNSTTDMADMNPVGVPLTGVNPTTATRTASFTITSPVGAIGAEAFNFSGDFLLSVGTDILADFSYQYDFSPAFDATGGGLLDSVELTIVSSDWGDAIAFPPNGKGDLSVTFRDTGSDIATWDILQPTAGTFQTPFSALSNAASVDFGSIDQVNVNFTDATQLDLQISEFGLIPEPSSALLVLLGGGFLVGRRRRS